MFELTSDYETVLPLMLASVLAKLVAARVLGPGSLLAEKLTRRDIRVATDEAPTVSEVMTFPVQPFTAGITIADAAARLAGTHSGYPLMDGDRCVGMVTRTDVLGEDAVVDEPVEASDPRDVFAVSPHDWVLAALQRMLDEALDHLPVFDGNGRPVGPRTDVLRARHPSSHPRRARARVAQAQVPAVPRTRRSRDEVQP